MRTISQDNTPHDCQIQEESEMWKLRDMEKQAQGPSCHRRPAPAYLARGSMHCDRIAAEGRSSSEDRLGERSEREARYWTRKLYEFEASDPDRWGHSGFKELYPEEFQSGSEKESSDGENVQRRKKKTKASLESEKHKRSKKSARKKKKKKKEKKKKKAGDSADDRSCSDRGLKRRKRSSGKTKHRRRRREKEQETRADSSPLSPGNGESAPRPRGSRRGKGEAGKRRMRSSQRRALRTESWGVGASLPSTSSTPWEAPERPLLVLELSIWECQRPVSRGEGYYGMRQAGTHGSTMADQVSGCPAEPTGTEAARDCPSAARPLVQQGQPCPVQCDTLSRTGDQHHFYCLLCTFVETRFVLFL